MMEDNEFENMWDAYSRRMDQANVMNLQAWALHVRTIEYVQTFRAENQLRSLVAFKSRAVAIGVIWSLLLGLLIYGNHFENIFFSGSLSILLLFAVVAMIVYVRQIILIKRINYGDSVVFIQEKLLKLQVSTIGIVRLLWLQLPFYTTFFWSWHWIANDDLFWFTAFPVTLIFTVLGFWLYRHISLENANEKWFKILLGKKEWTSIVVAKGYLEEIDTFKAGA